MKFLHPLTIPRRTALDHAGATHKADPPVPVGRALWPLGAFGVRKVTLEIWDPANTRLRRSFEGLTGVPGCLAVWDGKLYFDGNENTSPTYTGASDVFMSAEVDWSTSHSQKYWWKAKDTFQEDRVAIRLVDWHDGEFESVSDDPGDFAYIDGTPEFPDLRATLKKNGAYKDFDDFFDDIATSWSLKLTYKRGDQDQETVISTTTLFNPASESFSLNSFFSSSDIA